MAESSYWTRNGQIEIDLVGADRWPNARQISLVGSIKWREREPLDDRDLAALLKHRAQLPGCENAALIGVSRSGCRIFPPRYC
ncbi:MAG: hypothetical protein ACREN8_05680 [Candidatus Dormibacteraceae bacterium]